MHAPPDVNCYCKMTSLMELDGVTLFYTLEKRYKYMQMYATQLNYWQDFFSGGKLEEAEEFKCLFIVCV